MASGMSNRTCMPQNTAPSTRAEVRPPNQGRWTIVHSAGNRAEWPARFPSATNRSRSWVLRR